MARILVIVPFPLDEQGIANRREQLDSLSFCPDIAFDFRAVKAGPALLDSYHDSVIGDLALFEAALEAERDGYDAVCMDTISDTGMNAMRSYLDIPVIGPGRASYLMALLLGNRFSVLTQWDGWIPAYWKIAEEYGLAQKLISVRSINVMPDLRNLLGGKEEVIFPLLVAAGRQCVEDGADVVVLGSTTMHQAQPYLADNLPVPVISPGSVCYKLAEAVVDLGLTHSRKAYPKPHVPKPEMIHAMIEAARAHEG